MKPGNVRRISLILATVAAGFFASVAAAEEVKDLRVEHPMLRVPICWIIDDPGPFSTSTADYKRFGEWARKNGLKGKFSIVPCLGGKAALDGSAGEFPDHTRQERLEWIETIRTLYPPERWTLTPEVATHGLPWDFQNGRALEGQPREHEWLDKQPLEQQVAYISAAMRMLKDVGLEAQGLTTPWGGWRNVARNAAEALHKVYGQGFAVYFAEYGQGPAITYEDKAARLTAVSLRPQMWEIHRLDLIAELVKADKPVLPLNHANVLTRDKFNIESAAVEKLNQELGERLLWMTGREIGLYYATRAKLSWSAKKADGGLAISLATPWETPYVTVSFAVDGGKLEGLSMYADGTALQRLPEGQKKLIGGSWCVADGRAYVCLDKLSSTILTLGAKPPSSGPARALSAPATRPAQKN